MDHYQQALFPPRWIVLGQRLLPFSIGHEQAMSLAQIPLWKEEDWALPDFALAVLICANTFEENQKLLADRDLAAIGSRWAANLRGRWWLRRSIDWEYEAQKFGAYLAAGMRVPVLMIGKGQASHSPMAEKVCQLLSKFRLTRSEVLNMYRPLVYHAYYTYFDSRSDSVVHYQSEAIQRAKAKIRAEQRAQAQKAEKS